MAPHKTSPWIKAAVILLLAAGVVEIFGLVLPYWITQERGTVTVNYGLWRRCVDMGEGSTCSDIIWDDVEGWIHVVRGVEISGLLLIVGALAVTMIAIFCIDDKKRRRKTKLFAWLLSFFAAGLVILGVIVFAGESDENDYSGAFVITVLAGVTTLIAAVLGLLDWVLIQLLIVHADVPRRGVFT